MPLLMPALPPATVEVRPLWGEDAPLPQGVEGRCVEARLEEVRRHWSQRTEPAPEAEELDLDELTYAPLPPRRSFTVAVRYVHGGRGTPAKREYDLDE